MNTQIELLHCCRVRNRDLLCESILLKKKNLTNLVYFYPSAIEYIKSIVFFSFYSSLIEAKKKQNSRYAFFPK